MMTITICCYLLYYLILNYFSLFNYFLLENEVEIYKDFEKKGNPDFITKFFIHEFINILEKG